jgi:hypothetical protein
MNDLDEIKIEGHFEKCIVCENQHYFSDGEIEICPTCSKVFILVGHFVNDAEMEKDAPEIEGDFSCSRLTLWFIVQSDSILNETQKGAAFPALIIPALKIAVDSVNEAFKVMNIEYSEMEKQIELMRIGILPKPPQPAFMKHLKTS